MAETISFAHDTATGTVPLDIAYERRGAGPPVVLLHGIAHHWQAWEPVLSILATEREVIAVDLPGFGASAPLPAGVGYDLAGVVPVLAQLFRELGVERPHVVGNSLGGLLALELGRTGHARTVTALSPAGFWTEAERRYGFGVLRVMYRSARAMSDPFVARVAQTAAGRTALVGAVYARPGKRAPECVVAEARAMREGAGFAPSLAAGRAVRYADDLADIPVTIAWGTADRVLLPQQGLRAKRVIPGARLIRLPRCGHVPMNDDPALVSRVILDATATATSAAPAPATATGRVADRAGALSPAP
ncbi:alpha/beta fold hydrolase [Streptomyces buecherae]|uniref:alpha/beta fold hydrolase n=1 Tax=Streptomyces buecherae TaxID=2763006 RepID=UPI0037A43974